MSARLIIARRSGVVMLPLAIGLAVGGTVAWVTLSWGNIFIPWQLFWWSFVSLAIGLAVRRTADFKHFIPTDFPDSKLSQLLRAVRFIFRARTFILLAVGAVSIWITVVSRSTVEGYLAMPFAAFIYATSGSADTQLTKIKNSRHRARRESERKNRYLALTAAEKDEYEVGFLLAFYDLWCTKHANPIPLADILSKHPHECEAELLPSTLRRWIDHGCIKVELIEAAKLRPYEMSALRAPQRIVFLSENGRQICVRAKVAGMAVALRDHDRCLALSDTEKASFLDQFFTYIGELTDDGAHVVSRAEFSTLDAHPCALELGEQALEGLSDLKLIDISERIRISGQHYAMGGQGRPGIKLTETGKTISSIMKKKDTLENALAEHKSQLRKEEARHARCLEATSSQRVEFEDQFLQALFLATSGDTRQVKLDDVWKHLKHDCSRELTPHALRVWHERKCIYLSPYLFDRHHHEVLIERGIYEGTKLSLTAKGRDLCQRALVYGSMQEALSESSEGYLMGKNEIHLHDFTAEQVNVGRDQEITLTQYVSTTNADQLSRLAQELAETRDELLERRTASEQYIEIGELTKAEVAARAGDPQRVWQHLANVGKWVLDTANDIGKSLAVETITAVFRAHNIPM